MDRIAVRSSNIRSVGYDPATESLEVEFHSGSVYQYMKVPVTEYEGLIRASSKGRYLNQKVKGRYEGVRIR